MHDDRWERRGPPRGPRSLSRDMMARHEDSRSPFYDRRGPIPAPFDNRPHRLDSSSSLVDTTSNASAIPFSKDLIDRQAFVWNKKVPWDRYEREPSMLSSSIIPPPPPPPSVSENGRRHNNDPVSSMYGMGMDSGVMMNMFVSPNMPLPSMNSSYMMGPGAIAPAPMGAQDPSIMLNGPIAPIKEIIHCKSCTLFPPNPNAPQPTTRDRPLGCRTVFVGGLPENVTESILEEIFESKCGEISTLRLSKKNFCHVRFVFEASVDAALYLSGYRIRIGSNSDPQNVGRLHVDYAEARDDQYEWECRQRQLQREQRHRERMQEERMRVPSPPPVVHYTDRQAISITEEIKHDDTFDKAIQTVITWLERGDCNKRNVNSFYSMIQSTNAHVRRLFTEKAQYDEELKKAKDLFKGRMQGILLQFSHIERLFMAACHKKAWDHFTKAQRKNIEAWKTSSMDLKNMQLDDIQDKRDDDEMDVSDDDEPARKKQKPMSHEERNNLKDENDSLKCQVEAYKNEVEVLKSDHKQEIEEKEKENEILTKTLQSLQQQLVDLRKKQQDEDKQQYQKETNKTRNDARFSTPTEIISLDDEPESNFDSASTTESAMDKTDNLQSKINNRDAKLIGIISAFLNVHPFGAGLDYIWSYVSKVEPGTRTADIEGMMSKFPNVFRQDLSGIGANIERKWIFTGFNGSTGRD